MDPGQKHDFHPPCDDPGFSGHKSALIYSYFNIIVRHTSPLFVSPTACEEIQLILRGHSPACALV